MVANGSKFLTAAKGRPGQSGHFCTKKIQIIPMHVLARMETAAGWPAA